MDYFDDLDQAALDAFDELNDGTPEEFDASTRRYPFRPQQGHHTNVKSRMKYLFKLSEPITPTLLSTAAILPSQPQIVEGESEDGTILFSLIEERDIWKVKNWLTAEHPTFQATFAPVNKARKDFSPISIYPTLGVDTTMPQRRPQSLTERIISPAQDQIPVWYFFYGTLANSTFLAELFGSAHSVPVLHRATIYGGKLRTWSKKYKALVDSPGSRVDGWAYEVLSQDQEDALLAYETAKYQVVRVSIMFKESPNESQIVQGCTFRFAGEDKELDGP